MRRLLVGQGASKQLRMGMGWDGMGWDAAPQRYPGCRFVGEG
jgi:hypothetical protein